jgi:hypothetical protein
VRLIPDPNHRSYPAPERGGGLLDTDTLLEDRRIAATFLPYPRPSERLGKVVTA